MWPVPLQRDLRSVPAGPLTTVLLRTEPVAATERTEITENLDEQVVGGRAPSVKIGMSRWKRGLRNGERAGERMAPALHIRNYAVAPLCTRAVSSTCWKASMSAFRSLKRWVTWLLAESALTISAVRRRITSA